MNHLKIVDDMTTCKPIDDNRKNSHSAHVKDSELSKPYGKLIVNSDN